MRRILIATVLLILSGACATAPEIMPAADYEAALAEAKAEPHPYQQAEALEAVNQANLLSETQTARLLLERGKTLRLARIDLPGAISDLEAALSLMPPEAPEITQLQTELDYAPEDLAQSRARMQGLQTLPQWADDAVAAGDIEAVAVRYEESGLAPDEAMTRLLVAADYLCPAAEEAEPTFTLGQDISHLDGLTWCENQGVS